MSTRHATLEDLAALLQDQQARKLDLVVPARQLKMEDGDLVLEGTPPVIEDDGVTTSEGTYRPTAIFDEGIADKLGIPLAYVRRMREERPDLYDANVNGWLRDRVSAPKGSGPPWPTIQGDPRSFLLRLFRGGGNETGIARALLSSKYRTMDHLDVLVAGLAGVRDADAEAEVISCDLSERRMRVCVASPSVAVMAPTLLAGYRSPFGRGGIGREPWDTPEGRAHGWLQPSEQPVVFAGFMLSNSETGGGAFTLTPRLVVQLCRNGLTVTADQLRSVHLGGRLEDGVVQWSDETQERSLQLVTSMARDAVKSFLDVDYVERTIAALEAKAGAEVTQPQETVEHVAKKLRFTEAETQGVLAHFIAGGQLTAGGIMQAVTSFAQTVADPDAGADLEAAALPALEAAVAFAAG